MTRFLLVTLGVLLSLVSASETRAQSQLQMNRAASKDLRDAEAETTRVLALLFKMAESKPRALAKLKQAQSAWQAFRDEHVKAYWPSDEPGAYGTRHPMCVAIELTRLTRARVEKLGEMLKRVEGDACACLWPD